MGYKAPNMNIMCRVWSRAQVPFGPINPGTLGPHRVDLECQLRQPGKLSTGQDAAKYWAFCWEICVPKGSDLRDDFCPGGPDMVEVPLGSQRWYSIILVDDVGKDFANEYRVAFIMKNPPWPIPIP